MLINNIKLVYLFYLVNSKQMESWLMGNCNICHTLKCHFTGLAFKHKFELIMDFIDKPGSWHRMNWL